MVNSFARKLILIAPAFLFALPFSRGAEGPTPTTAALGSVDFRPSSENPVGWRGDGTGRYPAADPPVVWSRRKSATGYDVTNILWATKMPASSVATPIIVGDRIFVTAEVNDLVCLSKKDGRILWIRSNPEFEGLSEAERQANVVIADTLVPLSARLAKVNDHLAAALNADSKDVEKLVKERKDIDKQMNDALVAIDKKKFRRYWGQGVFGFAGPTPTSDGKSVFAFFTTGITACYDLDGNRKWIDYGRGGCSEHGNFASPLLLGNRLVVWAGEMRGYDIATGKIAFNNPAKTGNTYGSLFAIRVGDDWVAGFQSGYFTRISDGAPLWGEQIFGDAVPTPIVDGDTIFAWVGYPRNREGFGFKAYKTAPMTAATLKPAYVFNLEWSDTELPKDGKTHPFDRSYTASPLLVDGLIYQITQGGGLTVHDAATGALIYRKVLDLKPKTEYWNWAGASVSPTLAGRYIYLMDNQGTALVIKPGRQYIEVSKNVLEESANGKSQSQNLATPIFEGTSMYYRTPGYLYCIGEKAAARK